jgi:cytochrome b561
MILLLTLLLMHMGAALYHCSVNKDHFNVWKRMALPVRWD